MHKLLVNLGQYNFVTSEIIKVSMARRNNRASPAEKKASEIWCAFIIAFVFIKLYERREITRVRL